MGVRQLDQLPRCRTAPKVSSLPQSSPPIELNRFGLAGYFPAPRPLRMPKGSPKDAQRMLRDAQGGSGRLGSQIPSLQQVSAWMEGENSALDGWQGLENLESI